jgi:hypothetical protein
MISVETTDYGICFTLEGFVQPEEVEMSLGRLRTAADRQAPPFYVLVDMRDLKPLSPEAQENISEGQRYLKERGMERAALILSSAILAIQFKRLGQESGVYQYERYIDASSHQDWKRMALDWLIKGIDPDEG